MIRSVFSVFLVLLVLLGWQAKTSAQLFSEDFNGSSALASWTLIDVDGRTPASPVSRFTNAWVLSLDSAFADSCASSTSWYSPPGAADDWLISPAISLGSDNVLHWDAEAQDSQYPDGYEVRISTTSPTTASFLANPPLFTVAAENASWTRRSVNLKARGYENQTVYIAWRNNSNDQFILNIDNIVIDSISGNDAKLISALNIFDEYWQKPVPHANNFSFAAAIENKGADTIFNVKSIYQVYRNGQVVYTDSTPTQNALPPADTAFLVSAVSFAPIVSGDYHVIHTASFSGVDVDSSNNIISSDTIRISDSTFARHKGPATGTLGIGAGISGEIGTAFELNQADTLTSVSIYIGNGNGEMTGQPLSINLRDFSTAPDTIIATSDTITYTSVGASWVHFSFNRVGGYVPLNTGDFFIGVVERDSNLTLGIHPQTFTPQTNYITFPNSPFNGWAPIESFNFNLTFLIQPHFGPPPVLVSAKRKSSTSDSDLLIYPNPSSDGIFNVKLKDGQNSSVRYQLFSMSGELILEGGIRQQTMSDFQINIGDRAEGVYFLKIDEDRKSKIKKLVIAR